MSTLNKVMLIGRLGRDPEVHATQGNQKVVNLSVATSERWKDRATGDTKERTEWHRVVIFDPKLAEVAERYLRKGSLVYLEGQLRTRKWADQAGQERQSTEIVLPQFHGRLCLLGDRGEPAEPAEASAATRPRRSGRTATKPTTEEILDDEIVL